MWALKLLAYEPYEPLSYIHIKTYIYIYIYREREREREREKARQRERAHTDRIDTTPKK